MAKYLINWMIDLEASSPAEAARMALAMQQDKESLATIFTVTNPATGAESTVDCLSLEDEEGYLNTPCSACGDEHTPLHIGGQCGNCGPGLMSNLIA